MSENLLPRLEQKDGRGDDNLSTRYTAARSVMLGEEEEEEGEVWVEGPRPLPGVWERGLDLGQTE